MTSLPALQGPRRWRVDAALVGVALIWGSTFVLVKQALANVSTLLFLTLRFGAATLVLAGILGKGMRRQSPGDIRLGVRGGLLAGICLFSGYVLQTLGLKYTSAAKAGFLTGLYIPLVPLLGALVYKKIPQTAELLGVGLAFAGMTLMTVQAGLFSVGRGDLLEVGCAVAFAFHILALGHFAGRASTAVLTVTQIGTAGTLSAALFWWVETPNVHWSTDVIVALVVTSLLATALAFLVQTWAQRRTSPTRTALIFSSEPVFAWATSYILLGEVLGARAAAGAGLILAGILLVELKPVAWSRHPLS